MKVKHVDALVLSLASAGIIEIQCIHQTDRWNIGRTNPGNADAGVPKYQNKNSREGMNMHDENRQRRRNAKLLIKIRSKQDEVLGSDSVSESSDSDMELD